jgi:hypothetical protein
MPAPVPAPPNDTGDLVAPRNCDDAGFVYLDASRPGRDAPPPEWRSPTPDRVLPAGTNWGDPAGTLAACPSKESEPDRPGYSHPVYRPPCG